MKVTRYELFGGIVIGILTVFVISNLYYGTEETSVLYDPILEIEIIETQIVNLTQTKTLIINLSTSVINGTITIETLDLQASDISIYGDEIYRSDIQLPLELIAGTHLTELNFSIPITIEERTFRMLIEFSFMRGNQVSGGTMSFVVFFD